VASQLRLRIILPVAVLGLLGMAVGAFAFGGPPADSPPAAAASNLGGKAGAAKPAAKPAKAKRPKLSPLERALERNRVVVALFYAPDVAYDTIATREARAGALAARAGFLALDVTDDRAVGKLATAHDVRDAPAILVFRRGPRVGVRLSGYADREAVAQAAQNARR
jgi:hypothetical protein